VLCLLLLRFSPLRRGATSSAWALSGGAWFTSAMILLLASSSVFPAGDLAADRRMYLPMLGFAPATALLLLRRVPRRREFGVAAVAVLAVLSAIRVQVWRSPEALWREAVERAPDKVLPRIQLSRALAPTDAIAVLEEARRLDPESSAVAEELGRVYLETGQPALALGEFGRVLAARANDPKALNHRGLALLALGQTAAAQRDFYAALSVDPCLFAAHLNLRQTGARPPASNGCRFSPEQAQALQE
jgi:protein O-mannosyl-transferase